MRLAAGLLVVLAVLSGGWGASGDDTREIRRPPNARAPDPAMLPDPAEVAPLMFDVANAYRKQQKLTELKADAKLTAAAQQFAEYMASTNRYGHQADGRTPADRATAAKYDFCLIAENIASRWDSDGFTADGLARGFTQQWIDSPAHHENLVDPDQVHLGIGVARSADGVYFGVQMFGRPQSMAVRFAVRNDAKVPIRYSVDGENFELAPRGARQHILARTPTVRIEGIEESKQPPKPKVGGKIQVTQDRAGKLHVIASP